MRILLTFLIFLSVSVCANETSTRFGDHSWQFDTPSDKIAKQNSLVLYCQQNPKNCNQQTTTTTDGTRSISNGGDGGSSGGGLTLGGDSIIGNNITVVIEGDGNVVEIDSDQDLTDSPQTIDHNVSDNNVVIDQSTTTQVESDESERDDSEDDNTDTQ